MELHGSVSVFLLLALASFASGIRCPSEEWYYRKSSNNCYLIHGSTSPQTIQNPAGPISTTQTWSEVLEECKIRGGKLATFDNAEELDWVKGKLTNYWYWIGLTYENLKWEWYDGETYRPYNPIPTLDVITPTGSDAEKRNQRGALWYNSTSNKFTFDLEVASTYNKNGFICKGDWSSKPWCKVEEGWTYRNGSCYLYESDTQYFDRAEKICGAENGYISVPSTVQEDERMRDWLRSTLKVEKAWLGISMRPKNDTSTVDTVKWADGSDINGLQIKHWNTNNLTNYIANLTTGTDYCGVLTTRPSGYNGGSQWVAAAQDWEFASCNNYRPFVCEAPLNKCPYGWRHFDDRCYQFNQHRADLRTWEAARSNCTAQNADLVIVSSQKVHDYIVTVMDAIYTSATGRDKYWLGLQNKGATYGWVDNSPTTFTAWSSIDESTPIAGECAYVEGVRYNSFYKQWNATECTERYNYICSAPITADIQPVDVIEVEHTCEAPFVKYHEGCYLVMKEPMNRDAAQARCQSLGSSVLGIVRTFGENVWLQDRVTADSWLGLQITDVTSTTPKKYTYKYSDGTRVGEGSYMNFADYMYPSDSETNVKYCVAMAGVGSTYNITSYGYKAPRGKWYHLPCSEEREFVCYHDGTPEAVRPPYENKDDPMCGAGWFRNGTNCYRVHSNTAPWQLAKQTCQNADPTADLLWISTKEEQAFISDYLKNNASYTYSGYWINYYAESATSNWYWPYRTYTANKWYLPMAVTNWATGQPNMNVTSMGLPRCAYIGADYWLRPYQWSADKCNERHVFMCKKILTSMTPVVPVTPRPTPIPGQALGCKPGWQTIEGRCMHLNINRLSWDESRAYCRAQGGELFSVQSEEDLNFINFFAAGSWVGLNSILSPSNPRVYVWSDGNPFTYTPWNVQSHNSTFNCGAFTGPQGFAMYSCNERKAALCEAPLSSIDTTAPTGAPIRQDRGCQLYGYGHHDRCLYFGETPTTGQRTYRNFQEARDFCRTTYNGDLTVINTQEKQDYINAHMARFGTEFWIGLKEASTIWNAFGYWVNNTYVSRTNWAFAEPKTIGNGASRCVAMHGTHSETILPGDWYVDNCNERKYALCDAYRTYHPDHPTTPAPITTTTQRNGGCPTGWKTNSYNEFPSCYKAYLGTAEGEVKRVTWQQAENFCRRFRSGHLATVDTAAEQSYLTYTLLNSYDKTDQVWIGLRQNGAQNRWEWVDGKPLTSTYWSTTENHQSDQPDCVAMEVYFGKWIPQSCQQGWGWICEIPKGTYTDDELINGYPAAIEPNATCGVSTSDGDWYYSAGTQECLYFSRKPEPWNSAQAACRELGSNLVTVSNKTHEFITLKAQQFVANPTQFWIGLYQTDPLSQEYKWIDRHISVFRAWEAGEPSSAAQQLDDGRGGGEQCVAHNSWSARWKDLNCGRSQPFICHKSDREPEVKPTQDPNVGACPPDWIDFRGSCYFLSGPENKTFNEAKTACTNELTMDKGLPRGDLVSIHSSLENDLLVSHARRRHFGNDGLMYDFWIGLREYNNENILGWTDQTPVDYSNWHVNEPYNYYSDECITFGTDWLKVGRWKSATCTSRRAYICKAPKNPSAQPVAPPPTRCSAGYATFDNNCFIVQKLDAGQKTWQKAQDKCKNLGDGYGDIATIVDTFENAEMRVLFGNLLQNTGLRHETAWIGMKEESGSFNWHNTCPVVYSNFENLYATPQQDSACVVMKHDGRWNATACDAEADYVVCERRFTPCPAVHQQQDNFYCSDEFPHECNRTCYYIETGQSHRENSTRRNTLATARAACIAKGGHLASIRSEDDQTCLLEYTKLATQPMWIGLFEKKEGSTNVSYSWVWETDDATMSLPSSYVNWDVREPFTSEYSRYNCVEMKITGKWETRQCSGYSAPRDNGFICERRKEYREVSRRTTTLPPSSGSRKSDSPGPSAGSVAGIVIGVLIAVAVVGGIAYVVMTGKTQSVLNSVRGAGSRVTASATSRMGRSGFSGFGNTNYDNGSDTVRVGKDPAFHGEDDSYS